MDNILVSIESNTKSIKLILGMIEKLQQRQDNLIREVAKEVAKSKSQDST